MIEREPYERDPSYRAAINGAEALQCAIDELRSTISTHDIDARGNLAGPHRATWRLLHKQRHGWLHKAESIRRRYMQPARDDK